VAFVFLNIDIVHSSGLLGSGVERFQLFNDFGDYIDGKISGHKGHKVNWGKDGGIFLFGGRDTKENNMYHDAVLSAVDMLEGLNGFNMRRAHPEEDIKVRIAIHSGEAIYHDDLTRIESEELTILAKNERKIGLENVVVITGKVFNQLSIRSKIKSVFHNTNRKFEDLSLYSYPKFEPFELSYKYRDVYREQGFHDFMESVINDVDIESIDIIAHTGAVTVERFFSEIDKNKNIEASKRFKDEVSIRILLRDPEFENEDRSTSINRISRKIDNDYKGRRGYKVKKNFYHCMPVFNSVICNRGSDSEKDVPRKGSRLGFLSFYHFPNEAGKSKAHESAFIIDERKMGDNEFIDVYDSWFEHFWGKSDDIHTIIFDFDDTIADSHDIQIDAWVETVLNAYKRHNLELDDFNQEFIDSLGHPGSLNRNRTRNEIARIFFEEQRSEHIFIRIFSIKDEKKKVAIFNERRRLRMGKMSDNKPDSFTGAVDVLDHLSRDYNIAVISDTYEEVINNFFDEEKLRDEERLRSKFTYIMGSEKSVFDALDLDRIPGKGALLRKIVNIIGVPRKRLVYVGDSKYDYQACREVGIDFIEARLFPELLRRYTGKYTFLDSEPFEKHPYFTEWVDFVSALLEVKKSKSQSYR